jgi:hypothetical protein
VPSRRTDAGGAIGRDDLDACSYAGLLRKQMADHTGVRFDRGWVRRSVQPTAPDERELEAAE